MFYAQPRELIDTPSLGERTGFQENMVQTFHNDVLTERFIGAADNLNERVAKQISSIRSELGDDVIDAPTFQDGEYNNYMAYKTRGEQFPSGATRTAQDFESYNAKLAELKQQFPDKNIKTIDELYDETQQYARKLEAVSSDTQARAGLSGALGQFVGGFYADLYDPLTVATFGVGGVGKNLAMRVATEVGAATVIEGIDQVTGVANNRELLGLEQKTTGQKLGEAALGGVTAGGLRLGAEGVAPALQSVSRAINPQNRDAYYDSIKSAESGGKVNAKNPQSSATGLYQFTTGTWNDMVARYGEEYGLTKDGRTIPEQQEKAIRLFTAENEKIVENGIGRSPTNGELYIAHFAGAGRAIDIINNRNSDRPSADLVPQEYLSANETIFYKKDANGNRTINRSAKEVYDVLVGKVENRTQKTLRETRDNFAKTMNELNPLHRATKNRLDELADYEEAFNPIRGMDEVDADILHVRAMDEAIATFQGDMPARMRDFDIPVSAYEIRDAAPDAEPSTRFLTDAQNIYDNIQQLKALPDSPQDMLGYNPPTLKQFVKQQGGLQDIGGELKARDITNRSLPGLVRSEKAKLGLDEMRQYAVEAGYFPDVQDYNALSDSEFLDALAGDIANTPVYRAEDAEILNTQSQQIQQLDDYRANGFDEDMSIADIQQKMIDDYDAQQAIIERDNARFLRGAHDNDAALERFEAEEQQIIEHQLDELEQSLLLSENADALKTRIAEELRAVNVPEEQIDAYAALTESSYRAFVQRYGESESALRDIINARFEGLRVANDNTEQAGQTFYQETRESLGIDKPFNESDYRPSVTSWAKEEFGDRVAPDGSPVWQNFTQWFGDSIAVDTDGNPLKVYHGTKAISESDFAFDYEMIGTQGMDEGAGFYVTSNKEIAEQFSNEGTLIEGYLSSTKHITFSTPPLSQKQMKKLLKRAAEIEAEKNEEYIADGFLSNYANTYENSLDKVLSDASKSMMNNNTLLKQINRIAVEPESLNKALFDEFGYSAIISNGFDNLSKEAGNEIFVVFRPELIKSTQNLGNFSPDDARILEQSITPVATLRGDELPPHSKETVVKNARDYYRSNLQGTSVIRDDIGEVVFSAQGFNKTKSGLKTDATKYNLLPSLKHIIQDGEYKGRFPIEKSRKDGFIAFHFIEANVLINGKTVKTGVSIGEDANGKLFYNINKDPQLLKAKKDASVSSDIAVGIDASTTNPTLKQLSSQDVGDINLDIIENSTARGSITFTGNQSIIQLAKDVDPSTFVHEMGHFYTSVMHDMAARTDASQELMQDYKTLRDFVGAKEGARFTTDQEELMARAFEAYLREGNAPNEGLRGVFERMKQWLSDVYRSMRDLNVELNDDIRRVFDGWIDATENSADDIILELSTDDVSTGTMSFRDMMAELKQDKSILQAMKECAI